MIKSFEFKKIFKSERLIILLVCVLLLALVFMEASLRKEITIVDENKKIVINTVSFKVDKALKKAGVTLSQYDKLNVDRNEKLKDGMVIEIKRAFPVKINVDEKQLRVMTANDKVREVLKQYNIVLNNADRTEPSLDADIFPNDIINVIRVKEEKIKETVEIPYETIIKYNDEMESGKVKTVREGVKGKKEIEYRVVYENREEVTKEVISERVIKEPVDKLIEKGTEKYFVASRGKVVRYKKVLIMSATAYDLSYESCGKTPDHPEYGITYTGTRARPGVVAVDPKVIPLGSKLYVESLDGSEDYGFASAEDTGSAIKGNRIDLFMENHKDALRFGRRKVRVYVLE